MTLQEIMDKLESLANPDSIQGMGRFGITPEKTFGVRIPELRKLAKSIGKNHRFARKLWEAGYRETMILASMVDNPAEVSEEQLERWVKKFDYWEICDQCCTNLFKKTKFSYEKAFEWSSREEEFVKRAGFVLMACLAVSDKHVADERFETFFPIIIRESSDNRNFVKKAVNWALRQIGKRNIHLNRRAAQTAKQIQSIPSQSARWVAADALRELQSESIQNRLKG